jgi:uncharacterized protein YydD (DUF2326 family)
MLHSLNASDPRFKSVALRPYFNILVADKVAGAAATDSRNSAGKTSFIELLHFLLGANTDKESFLEKNALRDTTFQLTLDWPGLSEVLQVRRRPARKDVVSLDPLPPGSTSQIAGLGSGELRVSEWQALIERGLFGLPAEHPGVSGRTLLSFLIRRANSHGFNEPTRTFSRQSDVDGSTNLAFLLGLDWRLGDRYRQLKARESANNQLRKAANDPVLGRIVGKAADLRGQIAIAEHRVRELQRQVADFRVVPEYENLQRQANQIDRQIRESRNQDVLDNRNLEDISKALDEATDPDVDYLEPAYSELGVVLGDQVRRTFEEVRDFHASVVRNRRLYLGEEAAAIRARLDERERTRGQLGAQLAEILRLLREGGALDTLTALQQVLAQEQALLTALRHRYEAALALESSKREITQARAALQQEVTIELAERDSVIDEAAVLFSEFAKQLYGPEREAYLRFEPGQSSLKIVPHIASDNSRGIGSMVMFCFDLTVAVLAWRAGRAPNFLIHDSHLFDGVDERQLVRAFDLASQVCQQENLQYVITINSDDLAKANALGFRSSDFELETRLTDSYEDGGLFGFRF